MRIETKGNKMNRYPSQVLGSVVRLVIFGFSLTFVTTTSFAQRELPPLPAIVWPGTGDSDPARWSEEDVTPEQKFKTARAEALAAHQDAQNACKSDARRGSANLCLAQARVVFDSEMNVIRQRFGDIR
jgi:hypothetical protein